MSLCHLVTPRSPTILAGSLKVERKRGPRPSKRHRAHTSMVATALGRVELTSRPFLLDGSNYPRYATCPLLEEPSRRGRRGVRTAAAAMSLPPPLPLSERTKLRDDEDAEMPIGIVGGGVSGIYAALELVERGYRNVTLLERELRVGGKAAAFELAGKKYPLGAVSTPFALKEASFTGAQIFERPARFVRSVLTHSIGRLVVLNANNLVPPELSPSTRPRAFLQAELAGDPSAISDWTSAFGSEGAPERFYAHKIDFSRGGAGDPLAKNAQQKVLERWGAPTRSWPLIYVSAHGYGVPEATETPPFYYWARFAQKSTNAANKAKALPGVLPGPALRGWDTTTLLEKKLAQAGVRVRTGTAVEHISRAGTAVGASGGNGRITVRAEGGLSFDFEKLIYAADLRGALPFLADADAEERSLFGAIRHLPYYTVAANIDLRWLRTHSVYYLGGYQSGPGADAAAATAGCPTILLRPHRTNLTISWAYGNPSGGIGPPEIERCLRETVERLGGTFGGIAFIKAWPDYFPYVDATQLAANWHRKVDERQGRGGMYMVGEVFNLPLVSECIDWARYLVRQHFPRLAKEVAGAAGS